MLFQISVYMQPLSSEVKFAFLMTVSGVPPSCSVQQRPHKHEGTPTEPYRPGRELVATTNGVPPHRQLHGLLQLDQERGGVRKDLHQGQ